MGLWQVKICNLTEVRILTNNGAGSVLNSEWIVIFAIWEIHQHLWICNLKISHLLQLWSFNIQKLYLVLLFIFLAAQNFKVWINAQAQGCNPYCLLPAVAAVAVTAAVVVAAAAAGLLSVWHDARGTAWQTPWPQMCLQNSS